VRWIRKQRKEKEKEKKKKRQRNVMEKTAFLEL
jgi:hypothetical protein